MADRVRRGFDIKLISSVFDPEASSREIRMRNAESETPLYKVYLYLYDKEFDLPGVVVIK